MPGADDRPSRDDLAELRERMEFAGESDERIRKVLRVAARDREFYDDMLEAYDGINPLPDEYEPYPHYPGELLLGQDPDGHPVGISRRQLNEHMLVVGRTGAGKTTFFYNVMDALHEKDVPFLVFDFKNDYRQVVDDFDLTVVNWRELKFNPLQPPPGVADERWAEALAQTWAHAMGFMTLSKSYFLNKLRALYRLYRDEIEDGRYPTLFELRDLAEADEGKIPYASPRYRAKERTVGRAEMLTGFSGEIFDCSRGHSIEDLLDRNVVLELQEPVREAQQFVIETLLTWIFYYREAQGHRRGLRHAVLFDEAKMVFDGQREENTDIPHPPVTELMGRIRAFGEALVVADHEPSKLSDSVKANTNVKLWMSLGSGHDTEEMAATFGVEDDAVDFTRTLRRGEAVLLTAEAELVPVRLPPYTVDNSVSEEQVRERMAAALDEFGCRERVQPDRFLEAIGEFDHDESGETGESTDAPAEEAGGDEQGVGEVAEQLLASVNDSPFLSVSARYDRIGVGSQIGTDAKNELDALGLVQEVAIDNRKPGRNPKLLELTDQGEQVLEDRGYDVRVTGRRGIRHRYWQQQVMEYYEDEGFDVAVEHPVEDGRIDVYAEREDEQVAVEVAVSPEHEVANIRKCMDAGVDRVEVVALEDAVRERIETMVQEVFDGIPDAVVFVDAREYA